MVAKILGGRGLHLFVIFFGIAISVEQFFSGSGFGIWDLGSGD